MRFSISSKSIVVMLSSVFAIGIVSVSAAPQHATATEQSHGAAAPSKPAKPSANQAPPIPPAAGQSGSGKDSSKPPAPRAAAPIDPEPADDLRAADVLEMLTKGNARWVANSCVHPNEDPSRRASLADNGQHPQATILTCSDSRLPAERMFDCGVGDIFVIRVAGNVMGVSETGTIEYGIEHLHTPLLVVMGHSKCGAVNAAVAHAHLEGSLAKLVDLIDPAVERAHKLHPDMDGEALLLEAIRENVWQSIFDLLKTSEIIRHLAKDGKVKIVGAICDISTGKVEFLGEHPWQAELLSALDVPGETEHTEQAAATEDKH